MTPTPTLAPQGLDPFASRIRAALADRLDCAPEDVHLERPRQEALGQFALPCFPYARAAGGDPATLAAKLAEAFSDPEIRAVPSGPFLNFQIHPQALAATVLADALRPDFGAAGNGETVVVEFGSPNIAKPMHVGHLRTTVLGAALARIFSHLGDRVVRINHLGDWGSQFGKLLAAWQRWGDETALEADPIHHLLELYVRYHEEEEKDQELRAEAQRAFRELESGRENAARATWKRFTEFSLREFQKQFDRLGVSFDHVRGESWYEDQLQEVLDWLEGSGVLEESRGATIVNLEDQGIATPCLVKTAHGTTLYATRDLAAALSRWKEFHFDHALYVVGGEQKLHFRQFIAVLRKTGCEWAERIEHVPFGLVRLAEGKLSSRKGVVLLLEELLDRAVELAREIIEEKNPALADKDTIAERIGVGAVIFHELKTQRTKDVVFDWKEVLSFEGDTGPYLQYTHARCCAILRKSGRCAPGAGEVDASLLADSPELWTALGRFPAALREAAAKREPMLLAQALLRIAAAGNSFYREKHVLGSGAELENARLAAIDALRRTLALGLGLLGVPTPEEM